jgi:hypothetical protein
MENHVEPVDEKKRMGPESFRRENWLYATMLALALFGVSYTSVARQSITLYWVALVPVFALICLYASWRRVEGARWRWTLVSMELLHWVAVLVAMRLIFVADVEQMVNSDASGLLVLTLLALGTFTAGVRIRVWGVCVVAAVLALGVPIIAWLEQATLLLTLGVSAVVAIVLMVAPQHRAR